MTPPFFRPMKAMKSPMPQVTAIFSAERDGRDDLLAHAGDGEREEDDPLTNTMPSASFQGSPLPRQIVKVKKALIPMPGARAIG